jgi:rhodanese-related sulfurtransferase/peroxiredoxin
MPFRYCFVSSRAALGAVLLAGVLAACGDAPAADPALDADAEAPVTRSAPPSPAPQAAPDFTLPGVDGALTLSEHRGRVVLLTFWATWSEPSVAALDTMAALTAELAAEDLMAIAVAQDEHGLDSLRAWADAEVAGARAAVTLLSDSAHAVAHRYGDVEMLPTTVVIDREGRLRARHVGVLTADGLLDLVAPALIEEEPMAEAAPAADHGPAGAAAGEAVRTLEPAAVPSLVASGAALFDVRDAAARAAEGSVRHAAHAPLAALTPMDLPANIAAPVIFLGRTMAEAREAAEKAAAWGYGVVYFVGGGARAWRAAGLEVEPTPTPAPARRRGVVG